jgi:pimeloyl-ACP methyl ester carboxylesterase
MTRSRTVASDLSHEVRGEGPSIVLVPGGAATRATWSGLAPLLVEAGFRLVLYDHRGMGKSAVTDPPYSVDMLTDDLARLLAALDIRSAVLVGHSLGAAIAAQLLVKDPRVSRAVLIAGPAFSAFNRHWVNFLDGLLQLGGQHGIELMRVPSLLSVLPPHMLQDDELTESVLTSDPGLGDDLRGLRGHVQAAIEWHEHDPGALLEACASPISLISFSDDVHSPPGLARALLARAPSGRAIEISGHGHAGMQTAAPAVRDAIVEFLQQPGT